MSLVQSSLVRFWLALRRALGVTGLAFTLSSPVVVASPALGATRTPSPELIGLTPAERQAVRWSVGIAARQLRQPECRKAFAEFQLPDGSTPLQNLEATGLTAEEFLATLEWESGATSGRCGPGALLATVRNGRRVSVCPGFPKIVASRASFGATLVIHEQLHALGLGENPPTSSYITARVYHWCR
jgi:hypothetical protein